MTSFFVLHGKYAIKKQRCRDYSFLCFYFQARRASENNLLTSQEDQIKKEVGGSGVAGAATTEAVAAAATEAVAAAATEAVAAAPAAAAALPANST